MSSSAAKSSPGPQSSDDPAGEFVNPEEAGQEMSPVDVSEAMSPADEAEANDEIIAAASGDVLPSESNSEIPAESNSQISNGNADHDAGVYKSDAEVAEDDDELDERSNEEDNQEEDSLIAGSDDSGGSSSSSSGYHGALLMEAFDNGTIRAELDEQFSGIRDQLNLEFANRVGLPPPARSEPEGLADVDVAAILRRNEELERQNELLQEQLKRAAQQLVEQGHQVQPISLPNNLKEQVVKAQSSSSSRSSRPINFSSGKKANLATKRISNDVFSDNDSPILKTPKRKDVFSDDDAPILSQVAGGHQSKRPNNRVHSDDDAPIMSKVPNSPEKLKSDFKSSKPTLADPDDLPILQKAKDNIPILENGNSPTKPTATETENDVLFKVPWKSDAQYLLSLPNEEQQLIQLRGKYVYREHNLLPMPTKKLKGADTSAADAPAADARGKGDSSEKEDDSGQEDEGVVKINRNTRKTKKQELIGKILSRWWYCYPEYYYTEEELDKKVQKELDKKNITRLSLQEYYNKFKDPEGCLNTENLDAENDATENAVGQKSSASKISPSRRMKSPPKKVTEAFVYELGQFKGVFRTGSGRLLDLRPQPRVCYNWLNSKQSVPELKQRLEEGIKRQIKALRDKINGVVTSSTAYDVEVLQKLETELAKLQRSSPMVKRQAGN